MFASMCLDTLENNPDMESLDPKYISFLQSALSELVYEVTAVFKSKEGMETTNLANYGVYMKILILWCLKLNSFDCLAKFQDKYQRSKAHGCFYQKDAEFVNNFADQNPSYAVIFLSITKSNYN